MTVATASRRSTARLLVRLLAGTVRARPRPVARLAAWSLAEAVPTIVFGQAVARAVDAFRGGRPAVAACWLAVLAVSAATGAAGARRLYRPLADVVEPFRDELVRAVAGGALRRSADGGPDTGAVARLTHQVEIVRDTFGGILIVLRGFLFATAGALAGMATLMPEVALLVVPPLAAGLGLFGAVFGAAAVRQRRLIVGEERIAERTTALAEGLRDVVACGGEDGLRAVLGRDVDAQAAAARSVARMAAVRALALAIGGWGPALLILGAAPWLVGRGATAGTLVGALAYVLHGLHPALESLVGGMGGSGLRLAVTLGRILETSAPVKEEDDFVPPLGTFPSGGTVREPAVELRGVTFAYGPAAEPVIRDLDLVVPPGEHLAVVGPSGIGKSTLAALIAGTLRPRAGLVRVDGSPAGDPSSRVLIPQEAYVFDGTLRDNLVYLAPAAPPAAIARTVIAVGLEELTRRVGGLDTPLYPAALSAGERQLIALGRAHLAPAPLVVLDEAGSHLDPAAEAAAEEAFARRPGTLIVIAHRMSSALRARRVLVLDGTRADLGEHAELLARSPLYRDLLGHWTAGTSPRDAAPGADAGPGSQPPLVLGDADGLHPVARPDLAVDAGQVVADGSDLQHESGGYLRRGGPAGGQVEHFELALGQRAASGGQLGEDEVGVDDPLPVGDAPDRPDEVVQGGVLEHQPGRPRLDRPPHVPGPVAVRHQDGDAPGDLIAQGPRHGESVEARKIDVDQSDVGRVFAADLGHPPSGIDGGHDFPVPRPAGR
ncbi:ABC transporter ATP-binding protein [Actinomadura chibensis]|uniref:ABC transporter ATP-binding protein n=1 Tax=Actinomadura chibensis TaxID=392828 RepID=A0A5D0NK71_9ACTN|nr:ABC transporter ATP-binding protein [Actinomadura chibensis]